MKGNLFDFIILDVYIFNLWNDECKWSNSINSLINKWENLKLALRGAYLLILEFVYYEVAAEELNKLNIYTSNIKS